jgi:hypothetical protein
MYPGFAELVHKKINDGKLLMKNLVEGMVRRQKTASFGSIGRGRQVIEQNSILHIIGKYKSGREAKETTIYPKPWSRNPTKMANQRERPNE